MNDRFFKRLSETPFVYHYTSVDSLFAILEGYRQIKEHVMLPFRANCIYNVNDPKEMSLGFDAIKRFLPEYENETSNSMFLSEVFVDANNEKECREKSFSKPVDGTIEMGIVPYTSSFSSKEDFLPMWSMYGANSRGVCLKFDLIELIDYLSGNCQFGFVSYEGDANELLLRDNFIEIYDWVADRLERPMGIDEKIDELSTMCTCLSPFVKSSDWAYEQEFRIVYHKHYGLEFDQEFVKRILSKGIPKTKIEPFVYYPIYPNALKDIKIGPKANYNVIEHIIRNELRECLLNDVKISPSSIEII